MPDVGQIFSDYAHRLADDGPPKHAQLREILEEICRTQLKAGDMLPGERAIEQAFGISRITVRRAIGDLVNQGVLKRTRGKGTFVAPSALVTRLHLASFSSEMNAQDLQPSSKILAAGRMHAPQEVDAFFGSPSREHTHLKRLRLGNGLPYAIDDGWYNTDLVPDLLENDVYLSVYSILEDHYQLPVTEADQTATAVAADVEQARLLDVPVGAPLLKIVRFSLTDGQPLEYCASLYRTDRYTLKTHITRA
ncbi:GntR family transcriptional regulator [Corynebacterium sp. 13CS0277]|uniref:GntR family transcriptional regulator n=1 Tax=Corynebacterium sp. 13CS0277 TaxID=2071994 RepID=UPI000D02643B|nr:GntR family transcriptional regulator [Corynebacterium sp. 13CS0277]PRQ10500.1 GntR family transcriptional regulator [Corynebacterium sp. 13CS0277]